MMKLSDIKGIAGLLFVSLVCAFCFNALSPHGIALKGQWEKEKGVVHAISRDNPLDNSLEIHHPEQIRGIVDKKQRVILDARHPDFYLMGHLPGALSWTIDRVMEHTDEFLKTFKKDTPILTYCSGFNCQDSHHLANHLIFMGYTDVKVFPGGYEQWIEMGGQIEE